MRERVRIFEVGPRDGLQNDAGVIAVSDKVRFIDYLSACGFDHIEVASFVSPKRVPQMADSAEVMAQISRKAGVPYTALTPNIQGYDRARQAGADEIAIFVSASEGFSQANLSCSIDESFARFEPVALKARAEGIPVRGYVSCITDCPYEGRVSPASVLRVTKDLLALGCYEISLGDTIGKATPETLTALLDTLLADVRADTLAGHYHDTGGRALDNIRVSLDKGLRVFDASAGGLGGCPFAPGASGNVATGAVARLLAELGYETGIDLDRLDVAEAFARFLVGRPWNDTK